MGFCEFCGQESNTLTKVSTNGSIMDACSSCSKLGKVVYREENQVYSHTFTQRKTHKRNTIEVIPNYASKINSQMGKRGINSKQLANTLNIKDTTLQKYLSGKVKMDVDTARRFENYFEIKLTQEHETETLNPQYYLAQEEKMSNSSENSGQSSLGNLLMQKLREKEKK